MTFEKNVFVNCPFDSTYFPLLRPLLFTILYAGLVPRIALETIDSGEARLEKILRLIRESRYSVHDISRLEAVQAGETYRLNMPFELGVDYGCRRFGAPVLRSKKTLVLEADLHRYRAALSDLSGCDIEAHSNSPSQIVVAVRKWLRNACRLPIPGPARIWGDFNDFMAYNYDELTLQGFSDSDIQLLAIPELIECMAGWLSRGRP
jgi:hypothetical protein